MSEFVQSLPKSARADILRLGEGTFSNWLYDVSPDWQWNWQHLQHVRRYLASVTTGEVDKLMLFLPPRHGKSEMTTVRYAAWTLERAPASRIVIGAYNQTLANKFSRKVRRIATMRGVNIDRQRTAVEDWETLDGGGVRAVGVGAGVTGMGGNLIIIDDPVKNREEANSLTYREKVWQWYTDDLYTRREPGGRIILIMTRWHEDDLAGRILASDDGPNWKVVSLPAFAKAGDVLGRKPGAALCPERYDEAALSGIRTAIGVRAFTALYQQRPVEQEGGMFKRSYFRTPDTLPEMAAVARYWDLAATSDGGDYTAGCKIGRGEDGNYYILDLVHGQWSTNERDGIIEQTAQADGHSVSLIIEEEPGSSGKDRTGYLARRLAGYNTRGERVTGNKKFRAEPLASQMAAGNVYMIRAAWNNRFIDELCMFPNGANDDIVDAASGAFTKVAAGGWLAW